MRLLLATLAASTAALAQTEPCAKDREETGAWISRLAAQVDRSAVILGPEQHLASVAGPQLRLGGGGVSVTITQAMTSVAGRSTAAADLDKALRAAEALQKDLHSEVSPGATPGYVVVIDADVPWSRVVPVIIAVVKGGPRRVTFVFADPVAGPAAPGKSSVDPDLEEIRQTPEFGEKTKKLAAVSKKIFSACPGVVKSFAEPRESAELAPMLLKLVERLPRCSCELDLAALRAVLWMTFQVDAQTMIEVEVAAKGRPVAVKQSEVWSSAQAQVVAAAKGKGAIQLVASKK